MFVQKPNFPWGSPLNWQMLVYCFPSVLLVNITRVFFSLAFLDPLSGVRKRKLRADLGIRIKLSTNFAIKAGIWSKNRYIIYIVLFSFLEENISKVFPYRSIFKMKHGNIFITFFSFDLSFLQKTFCLKVEIRQQRNNKSRGRNKCWTFDLSSGKKSQKVIAIKKIN